MNIKVCGIELIPAYVGDYELGLVVDPGDLSGVISGRKPSPVLKRPPITGSLISPP